MGRARKIETFYKPLQKSGGIEVAGTVPSVQTYQVDTDEYTPDYTLAPLVLFPRCNATDRDNLLTLGNINASLTNMKWYEIVDGALTLIDSTNTNYEITTTGSEKGKIKVKKNSTLLQPVRLRFTADYVDTRNNDVYTYQYDKVIPCLDASDALPIVTVDSPRSQLYNPLRDAAEQTITAKVMLGNTDITSSAKCSIFWYRIDNNGNLDAVGTDGDNDWEIVSKTKDTIKINREYIGWEQNYVIKITYDAGGNPAAAPDDTSPMVVCSIIRQIPRLESDWSGVQSGVANGTSVIYPHAIIADTKGTLDDPDILKPVWSVKKPNEATYTKIAVGYTPTIEFIDGMMLKVDVEDKGPLCVITDGGIVIADSDNKILIDRLNP